MIFVSFSRISLSCMMGAVLFDVVPVLARPARQERPLQACGAGAYAVTGL